MTQKQICHWCDIIETKIIELRILERRLYEELGDLRKQCAHSSRSEFRRYGWKKSGLCDDCGERFFYK